mgnify:CR=1 FL=1
MLGDPCETCGNKYPARRQYLNETKTWICDGCGASEIYLPDVFWDGRPEENLADGPDGKPVTFLSRGQKARYLQERGIYEAGDRFHGAPFSSVSREDPGAKSRRSSAAVAEARRKVESMGQDVRRQAILKVIHDARNYAEKAAR